jgi:hypothetical protein
MHCPTGLFATSAGVMSARCTVPSLSMENLIEISGVTALP